jgi:hypothetical protein
VISDDFGDWRQAIPPFPAEVSLATFEFETLKKFSKIRKFGSKIAALRIFAGNPGSALVLTERDDFLGVIMPLLHSVEENRMPRWMPGPIDVQTHSPGEAAG